MKRDGYCTSLWQTCGDEYISRNFVDPGKVYDVLIVGGGITGMTTALRLQEQGLSCIVAEAMGLGFGTTGGTTAHLNTFLDTPYYMIRQHFGKDEALLVAKGVQQALDLIRDNITRYDIDCDFSEQPGYVFAGNEQEEKELEKIVSSAHEAGVDMQYVNTDPGGFPYTKIAEAPGQAQFHPVRYIYGMAEAYEAAGGFILQHSRVKEVVARNGLLEAAIPQGVLRARRVVYATHIPPGISLLHMRCAPYRSYAIAAVLADGDYPQGLVYDMQEPYHYYRTQNVNGQQYLIAGGEDHKTGHEDNTEARFRALEAHVRHFFNIEQVAYRWSSQYYEPVDGLPYIGALPGKDAGIYVATGFRGNGMILGTLSGQVLSDIITGKETPYEKLFSPDRIKPIAGWSNFVKEGADVAVELVESIFTSEKLEEMLSLAPGEARVVKYDGRKLAIFKDERSRLHIINPSCTHMHCDVAWNNAERTWDCPCHGSRFATDGTVWTGPATQDLQQMTDGKTLS